jgi:heme-degrading monooxygenase HmoA
MIIQFVKFKSNLSDAEVQQVMKDRVPRFRTLPGLVQKYYGYEKETGEFTGIYLWDSEQSLREFQQTELARTIPVAYKADGSPRNEIFEVLFPLRG